VQRTSDLAEDVREDGCPVERADAVLCINMVYIAPWGSRSNRKRAACSS